MSVKVEVPPLSIIHSAGWKKKSKEQEEFYFAKCDDLTGGYEYLPYMIKKRLGWLFWASPIAAYAIYAGIREGDILVVLLLMCYWAFFVADFINWHHKKCGKGRGNRDRYMFKPWKRYYKLSNSLAYYYTKSYDDGVGWPVQLGVYNLRLINKGVYDMFIKDRDKYVRLNNINREYFTSEFTDLLINNWKVR